MLVCEGGGYMVLFPLISHFMKHINSDTMCRFSVCLWRLARSFLLLFCWQFCASTPAFADERSDEEERLKVELIFNFSRFVEWPETAFADATSPFIACVLGDESIAQMLRPVQNRRHKGRAIRVKILTSLEDVKLCHIIYFDKQGTTTLEFLPDKVLGELPVLTISNDAKALSKGFAITFAWQDDKISLNMNLAVVRKAKLKVSAKLIEVANRSIGEVGR